ncbi:MAG: response regulator [Kiritimatiellia bacterium]|jgi:DNA-binding response OmpR family regulator
MSKKKILIVDDQREFVLLVNKGLRSRGYEVMAAYDPVQGYRMAIEKQPDLLLLDIQMPAGGGGSLFDNMQGNVLTAAIPVIFVTALDEPELKKAALESGAAGYMTKPVDLDELVQLIEQAGD